MLVLKNPIDYYCIFYILMDYKLSGLWINYNPISLDVTELELIKLIRALLNEKSFLEEFIEMLKQERFKFKGFC